MGFFIMDKILLTHSKLKELGISKNSCAVKQLQALGQEKTKGWFDRLFHSVITQSQFEKALSLKKQSKEEKRQYIIERRNKRRAERKKLRALNIETRQSKKKHKKKKNKEKSGQWWAKYRKYLLSKEWADIRIDLFNSRGRKCERCSSTKSLQIHHLHYRNVFKEEPQDLMILCSVCHQLEHGK